MRVDRLQKLYDFYNTVDEKKCNQEKWVCGTNRCLGGWACMRFRRSGLKLDKDILGYYPCLSGSVTGIEALSIFFDIPHLEANSLFGYTKYTKRQVLSRIKYLIRHGTLVNWTKNCKP